MSSDLESLADRDSGFGGPPIHYAGEREAIDLIRDALGTDERFAAWCEGNVYKYRLRAGKKGPASLDAEKERFYTEMLPWSISPALEREAVECARLMDADGLGALAHRVAQEVGFGAASDYASLITMHAEWVLHGRRMLRVGPGAAKELAGFPLAFPAPADLPVWSACIVDLRGCGFTLPCLDEKTGEIEGVYLLWHQVRDEWRLTLHSVLAPFPGGESTKCAGCGYLRNLEDFSQSEAPAFVVAVHAMLAASRVDLVELVTKPGDRKGSKGSAHVQRLHLKPGALETWRRVYLRGGPPEGQEGIEDSGGYPTPPESPECQDGQRAPAPGGRAVGLHLVRGHEAVFWVRHPRPEEVTLDTRGKLSAVIRPRKEHLSGTKTATSKDARIG
jgi:hypothetical protein